MKKPDVQYIAVKALIKNDEAKVLVLKQSDTTISGHNKFHPPGGIVELGESVEECLVREVKEETGVAAKVLDLFDVGEWYAQRDDTLMQFVGLFYICHIESSDFKLQSSEVSGVAWVGVQDIDELDIVEPSKSIIKRYLAEAQ